MTGLRDATLDLLLGGACVGCSAPGRVLCPECRAGLPTAASVHPPSPWPPGLAPPYAVTAYDGVVREVVLGHKERRLLALTPVLGLLLARAVAAALHDAQARGPLLLVPVPSRAASVRSRGHDPTLAMTVAAARLLGHDTHVAPLLRSRHGVVDQAGLGVAARRANLAGSMAARPGPLRRWAARGLAAHVVVCDDVLTTGSTAGEAQRALEAVGVGVLAVAVVAATPRRDRDPPAARLHGDSSGPEVPPAGATD